jgi:hypothetical protein
MKKALQLVASVGTGGIVSPQLVNPDGTQSPFSIPKDTVFVVTDVSIQQERVAAPLGLFNVSLTQTPGTTHQLRWAFVGSATQNFERAFNTGIAFSTPFHVESGGQDAVVVRMWGFFQERVPVT